MSKPVLDLSTAPPPPRHVVIDGTPYVLAWPQKLKLPDYAAVLHVGQRLQAFGRAEVTEDDTAALFSRMSDLLPKILAAPAEVVARLTGDQQIRILTVFVDGASGVPGDAATPDAPSAAE